MEVGQPSSKAPEKVINSAEESLRSNMLGYTNALGINPLRNAIAKHYKDKYDITINPKRVIVTTGSSAGFLLAFIGCFDVGDHVALASVGYPCYRNIMSATNVKYCR
jgi:aspartate/methionine/tyrosine aminotransferase